MTALQEAPQTTEPRVPGDVLLHRLTPEQLDAFGAEMDAIRRRVIDELGDEDATYIRELRPGSPIQSYCPCMTLWPISMLSRIFDTLRAVTASGQAGGR